MRPTKIYTSLTATDLAWSEAGPRSASAAARTTGRCQHGRPGRGPSFRGGGPGRCLAARFSAIAAPCT